LVQSNVGTGWKTHVHDANCAPATYRASCVLDFFVLPTFDRIMELIGQGKVLAGGLIAGTRICSFIIDVKSNDEGDELLHSLPIWGPWTSP